MEKVTVDNFVRAESDRYMAGLAQSAGGVNRWHHARVPAPVDNQIVIRMNRDTLYSHALVDLAEGATVVIPDTGGRYLSVMVVDRDHHVTDVLHDPGRHELTPSDGDGRYVAVVARVLADPNDPDDLAEAHRVQDGLRLEAGSSEPFTPMAADRKSLKAVRDAILALASFGVDSRRAFGRAGEVDPVQHLLGTAAGWGGLPESEAVYLIADEGLPVGEYRMVFRDVPVDGFWSVSVYGADGYFVPNDAGAYSVNDLTAVPEDDRSVVVHLGGCGDGRPNCIPITEGWNYVVRLYRPRGAVLDGSWRGPKVEPIEAG